MKKQNLFSVWLSMFGFSLLIVIVGFAVVVFGAAIMETLLQQTKTVQFIAGMLFVAFGISVFLTGIYRTSHHDLK